jgi:hypothetical protein
MKELKKKTFLEEEQTYLDKYILNMNQMIFHYYLQHKLHHGEIDTSNLNEENKILFGILIKFPNFSQQIIYILHVINSSKKCKIVDLK